MAAFMCTRHWLKNVARHSSPLVFETRSCCGHAGTIGFIGLGNMGGHMANNLLKSKHKVLVCDIVPESVKQAEAAGAQSVSCPSEVAEQSDLIITMLPSSPQVQKVYTDKDGIFSSVKPGTVMIDSSTIDPLVSQQMAQSAAQKQVTYLDAPVSGGVLAARDGLLTFMVGGPTKEFEVAEKVLKHMGKNVVHCGPVGTGQAAKICNNMLLAISMIGVSESMNLGTRLGLDPKMLAKIINMSTGRCWSSELYNPCPGIVEGVPSSRGYEGGFGSALMAKDLGLAQNAAAETKSSTPLGTSAHEIYQTICSQGYDKLDFSSVFKYLQEKK